MQINNCFMENKKKKIGVYICHCGGNISDYVDVEKVRSAVEGEDIVFLAKTTMFACSDSNQREMVEDIGWRCCCFLLPETPFAHLP
jgi:hypothetical protein